MQFFKERLTERELKLLADEIGAEIEDVRVVNGKQDGAFLGAEAVVIVFDDYALRFTAKTGGTDQEGLTCCRVAFAETDNPDEGESVLAELAGKELASVDVLEETQTGPGRIEALMYDTTLLFRFDDGSTFALSTFNQLPNRIEAVVDPEEIAMFENEYIMRWQVE